MVIFIMVQSSGKLAVEQPAGTGVLKSMIQRAPDDCDRAPLLVKVTCFRSRLVSPAARRLAAVACGAIENNRCKRKIIALFVTQIPSILVGGNLSS